MSSSSSNNNNNLSTSSNQSWMHLPVPGDAGKPPPLAVHMHGKNSNNAMINDSRLDAHLARLQEEQQHERLAKNQKSKLLQKNLESLRGLVKEIQGNDWKYNHSEESAMLSEQFTRMQAWGSNNL